MAKILTFQNREDAPSEQDFLADENQTLSFRRTEDGGVSLGNITRSGLSGIFPDPKKDWSNQELADLFRVRQLLSGANVPVETDRGVTDEGDPWFVFCHANGEVFIHLCRIDGVYVLDSPNVLRPLRGADFNELIADFTNQALPASNANGESERRVIRLERGGKVSLHPSAMLAALIWTLFLASEELVLLAPEDTAVDDDSLVGLEGLFPVEVAGNLDFETLLAEDDINLDDLVKADFHELEFSVPDAHVSIREALQQQQGLTLHNNAFTIGLSTIAIAMGFMSETVLLDNQRKILESLEKLDLASRLDGDQATGGVSVASDMKSDSVLEMLVEFLALDFARETQSADLYADDVNASSAQVDERALSEWADTVEGNDAPKKVASVRRNDDETDVSSDDIPFAVASAEHLPETARDDSEGPLQLEKADAAGPTSDLASIMLSHQLEMEKIQLDQGTLWISSALDTPDAFNLVELIETKPNTEAEKTQLDDFEDIAQRVVDFLQSKSGNFGVLELRSGNGIVFVDRTAVVDGEFDYIQWESSDGKVVSLIGLEADFQQFDMIA